MEDKSSFPLGRVLVIDDEAALVSVVCEMLTNMGYETAGFVSGEKALSALREHNFDILLTDIIMPEMDGIELLQVASQSNPYLVGILMTGQAAVRTAIEAIKIGAFDYIEKPFNADTLSSVLSRAMEMRRLKIENIQLHEAIGIHELAKTIAVSFDVEAILNKFADAAQGLVEADEVSIMLPVNENENELYVAVVCGTHLMPFMGTRVFIQEGIAGWVAKNLETLTLDGMVHDDRFQSTYLRNDIRSAASIPILSGGKFLGVLNVKTTHSRRCFMPGQIKGLTILVSLVAPVLESAHLYRRIHQEEKRYRDIFDNAIEGIFQATPAKLYIAANKALAHIYGYISPKELMSSIGNIELEQYVNPSFYREFMDILIKHGSISNYVVQHYHKDRSVIWVALNARVVYSNNGELLYYEGSCEDITTRKNAEEVLKKTVYKLKKATDGIIAVLVTSVEARDPSTSGHQKRVAELTTAIARAMGLSPERIDGIQMAAMIHDIGKISIPAEILSLPRNLTVLEYSFIKTHPMIGHSILKDIDFPWPIDQIVLQHHERLDGSGYPQGLKDGQILLEAQIICIADVVEAMASHRPYRPALGIDVALDEIEKNKGTLYNAEAVEACVRLFREKGFKFE